MSGSKNAEMDIVKSNINYFRDVKSRVIDAKSNVFVFVSIDITNSTKFKYRNAHWLKVIEQFITIATNHVYGLDFWKFNGDEVLFYAEVRSVNQIVDIISKLESFSDKISNALQFQVASDGNIAYSSDLIDVKTSIWIAPMCRSNVGLNAIIYSGNHLDFSGINMDEGFRMSKCATQSKIIVDPKIALLITAIADELKTKKLSLLKPKKIHNLKDTIPLTSSFDENFNKFILFDDTADFGQFSSLTYNEAKKIIEVANNFRLVEYKSCKGVWDERPYPIIWFSNNWTELISKTKYDEKFDEHSITTEYIEHHYTNMQQGAEKYERTLMLLKKLYNNISVMNTAFNQIIFKSHFNFYLDIYLKKEIDVKTFLYYSIVCVKQDTKGVLAFKRSHKRMHLPLVWDFVYQKTSQVTGQSIIAQIVERFKKEFDLDIEIDIDTARESIRPRAIYPVYRSGKIHHGILCFAKIMNDCSEEELIDKLKQKFPNVVARFGYPLYVDAKFIHCSDFSKEQDDSDSDINKCKSWRNEGRIITELSYDDIYRDSNPNCIHVEGYLDDKCTANFVQTINEAIEWCEKNNE